MKQRVEAGNLRTATGQDDATDLAVGRRRAEEVERTGDLSNHRIAYGPHGLLHLVRHNFLAFLGTRTAELDALGLLETDRERLLDLFGELVASRGDVAGEGRHYVRKNVDVRGLGADVDQ